MTTAEPAAYWRLANQEAWAADEVTSMKKSGRPTSICSNAWACRSNRFFALRIFLHPYPRTRDNLGEIALGGPSQHASSFRWVGHQNRRIARSPRYNPSPNRPSSGVFHRPDDFENGMSPARPQIDGQRHAALFSGAVFELLRFKVLQRNNSKTAPLKRAACRWPSIWGQIGRAHV